MSNEKYKRHVKFTDGTVLPLDDDIIVAMEQVLGVLSTTSENKVGFSYHHDSEPHRHIASMIGKTDDESERNHQSRIYNWLFEFSKRVYPNLPMSQTNPNGEPVGPYTGRCGRCGSNDLWDDATWYGCNNCGSMYQQ